MQRNLYDKATIIKPPLKRMKKGQGFGPPQSHIASRILFKEISKVGRTGQGNGSVDTKSAVVSRRGVLFRTQ